MKLRLLVLGMILLGLAARSEAGSPVHFGTEGGLTLSSLSGVDVSNIGDSLSSHIGFAAGLFFQVDVSKTFAIEAEALYSQKGSDALQTGTSVTFDLSYVEVPVLLKFYLPMEVVKPYAFVGGAMNFNVLAQQVTSGTPTDISNIKSTDVGVIGGVGVDIDKWFINARYELGLNDISDTTKVQNGTLMVMTGVSFM